MLFALQRSGPDGMSSHVPGPWTHGGDKRTTARVCEMNECRHEEGIGLLFSTVQPETGLCSESCACANYHGTYIRL